MKTSAFEDAMLDNLKTAGPPPNPAQSLLCGK